MTSLAHPAAPTYYPANGTSGTCRHDRAVTYVCGTNGPGPGTWFHKDDSTPCPSKPEPTATPCTHTNTSRWHAPADPMNALGEWTEDPGPYTVGESVTCPHCGTEAPVTRTVTNRRSAGTQYVAHLAQH